MLAPVDRFASWAVQLFHALRSERLGHEVVVVVDALRSHAGVFVERVVTAKPVDDSLHALVVAADPGIGETHHSGVAD